MIYPDGSAEQIASVDRPVQGTGRYDGTTFTGVGAVNTSHGGVLTVSPNGTYTWQAYKNDAPAQLLRGTWRKATPTEMRYQGGDGIVLLKAKSGWDWVVCQDRQATSGEWIRVAEVVSRQVREFGARAKR